MERRKEENVGDVILRFLRQMSLETPLAEHRAVSLWSQIAPPALVRHTREVNIYNQKLYVHLDSAALKPELLMRRTALVEEINKAVGSQVITDICPR